MRIKGLNNDDVMQTALCTLIYAPSPCRLFSLAGLAVALLDRQLKEALGIQDCNINVSASQHSLSQQASFSPFYLQRKILYITPTLIE